MASALLLSDSFGEGRTPWKLSGGVSASACCAPTHPIQSVDAQRNFAKT